MLKNLFTQNNIKKILARWLVMVLGMAWTFADGQDPKLLEKAAVMHNVIVFLSWIWVLLCMLAGKVMTNGLLFGGDFGLDVYLWTIWNMMKNIANFGLWFIFLIVIVKEIFALNIQDSLADIGKKLSRFLIGGILIQASWFILLALISLSTIVGSAVASFPSMVIQADSSRWSKIISQVNAKGALHGSQYTIKSSNTWSPKNLILQYTTGTTVGITDQETLDFLMPRYDSLGGPLYFMGMSVVGFQDYTSFHPTTSENLKTMITWFIIKLIVTLAYAVIIIILILINIVRIIKIWIFIGLLPLNIALWVLKHEDVSILGEDDASVGTYVGKFNRSGLIGLILQPTIITGIMGLSMIVLAAFWSVLGSTNNVDTAAINAAYNVTLTNSQFTSDSVDIHMVGNLLDGTISQVGWLFQSLLLIGLTFGLMGLVLYVSAKVTKEEWIQSLIWSAGKLMTSIPFLPITQSMAGFTKAANDMSGGKLKQAYDSFKSWHGVQLDEDAAEHMAELRGTTSNKKVSQRQYQIKNAKKFETIQTATADRYAHQKIKDFQQIYNSEWRQENFVKHYDEIGSKPLGDIRKNHIEDLHKAMQTKTNRDALKAILFPNITTPIKWFDDHDRGNTVVTNTTPPPATTTTATPGKGAKK